MSRRLCSDIRSVFFTAAHTWRLKSYLGEEKEGREGGREGGREVKERGRRKGRRKGGERGEGEMRER